MFSVEESDKEKLIDCYEDPEELLHVVCVNLLTLAKVQTDDYLMTTGHLFAIQRPSDYRVVPIGLFRFYYGFSRSTTLSNIKQLFFAAKHLLQNVKSLTEEERKKVRELVSKSHKGLRKLQVTYIKDVSVYSEIQIIVDETSRGIYTTDLMPNSAVHTTNYS
jgi:hypothetical protein